MRPHKGIWPAIGVHLFTALGAVCAFLAVLALVDGALERMFVWLGAALVIDGFDGPMARRARVATRLPRFSGERLDLVIDYQTYVFIPALALWQSGVLAGSLGLILAAAILISSLFHFADMESKAEDNSFVGFPAVWNVVAFYILALEMDALTASAVVSACVALTFVPWRWVHPWRVAALRPLTLAVFAAGAGAAAWTMITGFPARPMAQVILIAVALYAIGLTLVRRRA